MRATRSRIKDFAVLVIWTAIVTSVSLILRPKGAYVTTFLYFVVPSVYLLWRYRLNTKKILAGSLLIGIVIPLSFDILINFNQAWFVPDDQLLISFRLFGFYPIDEIIWFFFVALYAILFYEIFVDYERTKRLSPNFVPALAVWLFAILLTVLSVVLLGEPKIHNYPYLLIVGPFSLPPIIYVLSLRPRLAYKFVIPTVFFFFVAFNFEIVALTLGNWEFMSSYISLLEIFGRAIPVEEFVYWILLYPATAISYYELLVDDGK